MKSAMNEARLTHAVRLSFMDASFRKQLESALRFGTTLFIHDAENFDPLLNPVLNRDLRRTAGRVLITIGDKDIDFSPTFRMFLFTRDSDVRIERRSNTFLTISLSL